MKVYFTASISQREKGMDAEHRAIYKTIERLGHEVLTSYDVLNSPLHGILSQKYQETIKFYQVWSKTIPKAEVAVLETSFPSTVNIGLELSQLLEKGKPVICLYKHGRDPNFIGEFHSNRIIKLEYDLDDLEDVLQFGFEEAIKMLNRRFTFFITPEIETFLDKISRDKSISKSEYLRGLVENEIQNN